MARRVGCFGGTSKSGSRASGACREAAGGEYLAKMRALVGMMGPIGEDRDGAESRVHCCVQVGPLPTAFLQTMAVLVSPVPSSHGASPLLLAGAGWDATVRATVLSERDAIWSRCHMWRSEGGEAWRQNGNMAMLSGRSDMIGGERMEEISGGSGKGSPSEDSEKQTAFPICPMATGEWQANPDPVTLVLAPTVRTEKENGLGGGAYVLLTPRWDFLGSSTTSRKIKNIESCVWAFLLVYVWIYILPRPENPFLTTS